MEPISINKITEEDRVTSSSDVVCPDRSLTNFDSAYNLTIKSPATGGMSTTDYIKSMKLSTSPATKPITNLCGKKLTNGKRCQTENVGGCANTGCSEHYGWQDEVEGFRLRTF